MRTLPSRALLLALAAAATLTASGCARNRQRGDLPYVARDVGTLYTAAYAPCSGKVELFWPGQSWPQTLGAFADGDREITYSNPAP